MFDNIGTVLVQALGFFGVFGYFVYQLLSEGKKSTQNKSKSTAKKFNETTDLKDIPKKQGLFGRKKELIKEDVNPKRNGLFGKKIEPVKLVKDPKKKRWF